MLSYFVLLQGLLISAAPAGGFPFFQKVPIEYINPRENPHSECPTQTHILGHGIATSELEARKGARADVIRQIRSRIYTQAERVSTAMQSDTQQSSSTSLTNTIVEESDFAYAEMITDIGSIYKKRKQHYALSCLNKEKTSQHIYNQIKEEVKRFLARAERSQQLFQQQDRVGFTTHYPQTIALSEKLYPELLLIRTLHPLPQVESALVQRTAIKKQASALHESISIGLASNDASVQSGLIDILTSYNITALPSLDKCLDTQTHFYSIDTTATCTKKMGNHFCRLNVILTLVDCLSQKKYTHLLDNSIVGADSRKKERAIANAHKLLSIQEYEEKIRDSIRIFSPLLSDSHDR